MTVNIQLSKINLQTSLSAINYMKNVPSKLFQLHMCIYYYYYLLTRVSTLLLEKKIQDFPGPP